MSDLIKWSGSKNSQAKNIISFFPKNIDTYYEPLLGGGSIFLALLESNLNINKFILSDINAELIGIYELIKNNPDKIINTYNKHHKEFNSGDVQKRKDYFVEVRNDFNLNKKSEDFYFIMRTTTNGMPRYNRAGLFNNSCHFSRPGMKPDDVAELIKHYNKLFNSKDITFLCGDYASLNPNIDDLVYCDPPYENTKGMYFGGFDNLRFINWINNLNCKWLLSYDGKINDEMVNHISPNYIRHEYLVSGNSSFRRVIGNSKDSIVSESLYLNF